MRAVDSTRRLPTGTVPLTALTTAAAIHMPPSEIARIPSAAATGHTCRIPRNCSPTMSMSRPPMVSTMAIQAGEDRHVEQEEVD